MNGPGATIGSDGFYVRGTYVEGRLDGIGQKVYPNRESDIGQMKGGYLDGEGVRTGQRNGKDYVMEGRFIGGSAEGTMRVTYADGTSQKEIWSKGKLVLSGPLAAAGVEPITPVIKTKEQLAQEAEARFDASLDGVSTAGALYVMADELAEQGNTARARKALRALVRRFPDSPMALRAADRLAALGSGSASSGIAGGAAPARSGAPGSAGFSVGGPSGGPCLATPKAEDDRINGALHAMKQRHPMPRATEWAAARWK